MSVGTAGTAERAGTHPCVDVFVLVAAQAVPPRELARRLAGAAVAVGDVVQHEADDLGHAALALRRDRPELGDGSLTWIETDAPEAVLAFRRDPGFVCVVNVGDEPAAPPDAVRDGQLLLASAPLPPDGALPGATAAWYGV